MTREEFIQGYCERSKIDRERLFKSRRVIPCDCGDESCRGWAMVPVSWCESIEPKLEEKRELL